MADYRKSSVHCHSTMCDGRNTLQEMASAACAQGLTTLGFSGHSYTFFDESYAMSRQNTDRYRQEVEALKREYAGRIRILCGVEQDYFSRMPTDGYDFVIGSVHYVLHEGTYVPVDNSKEDFIRDVQWYFDGDYLAFCEEYYAQVAQVLQVTGADVVGHFDLVTKFNEGNALFDESDPRYVAASQAALDALIGQGALFEINTGAVVKGYRSEPYPSVPLLKRIADAGGKVILSSDCHRADKLLAGIPEADALAQRLGLQVVREL